MKSNLFEIKMMDGTEKLVSELTKEKLMKLKIIDDFLKPKDFDILQNTLLEDSSFQ